MKITFGFSKNKDSQPFSVAIRLMEKRPYSHVYVKYEDEVTKDIMIFQASHGKVNLMLESKFLDVNTIIEEYEMQVTPEVYMNIRKQMNIYLGLNYGFLQILNITIQKIFKTKDIKLTENGNKEFICSELGYIILKMAYPAVMEDQDSVTPSDFNVIINKIGLRRTV